MWNIGYEMSDDVFVSMSLDLLERGHKVRFRAPGWSMHPSIRDSETITVVPVSPLEVRRGDIVFYRCNGNVFAHRVVDIEREEEDALRFTLRGDALGSPDESVASHQILGKVVSVERGGYSVDPYSWTAKIYQRVRLFASRLKRLIVSLS
jgi:hypothetical protein